LGIVPLATSEVNLGSWKNIFKCLSSKRLGRGYFVDRLERLFCEYFGVKHVIATCNGTLADTVMLSTLKAMRGGKYVILPAFTFVAHANSVLWAGLIPQFVDVDLSMRMDLNATARVPESKVLCYFPAHILGRDCTIKSMGIPLPNITILEDCCEAMGGDMSLPVFDKSKKLGTFGMAGSFSMFPSHTITTGEGGLIITNDDDFAEIARSIMNHGKWRTQDFDFNFVGINAKMSDLQAAVGCSLVGTIDRVNEQRRKNVALYNKLLGANYFATAPHCYPVFYPSKAERDTALGVLRERNVECRKLMGCIPSYSFYKSYAVEEFPIAQRIADCGLYVPVHQNLKRSDIERTCDVIYETRG